MLLYSDIVLARRLGDSADQDSLSDSNPAIWKVVWPETIFYGSCALKENEAYGSFLVFLSSAKHPEGFSWLISWSDRYPHSSIVFFSFYDCYRLPNQYFFFKTVSGTVQGLQRQLQWPFKKREQNLRPNFYFSDSFSYHQCQRYFLSEENFHYTTTCIC